ncbi:hypothetical protein GPECTOR_1g344 [Gonium pectorale]|uniref:Uncharacterized protein n=1 Tax=Gonium pectorale TaxID=33097 RepID=A0A150H3H2_GONPE|nr:hypothetical protein GPECTOR_1g344 [Gonium pectorale]|eukprot:KXZ56388.1 hypothetical protein GPECTOR_1g344 [Gonium pectorale]
MSVCALPLTPARIAAAGAGLPGELAVYGAALATYRLPSLHVSYTLSTLLATRVRLEGVQRTQQAARAARQAGGVALGPWAAPAAQAAAAQSHPQKGQLQNPQQPYYDLAAPLTAALLTLLGAAAAPSTDPRAWVQPSAVPPPPPRPGQWIRSLVLRLESLPAPAALAPLALLPSLTDLALEGGWGAFLELGHLEALEALTRLTSLSLEGVWDMVRPSSVHAVPVGGQHGHPFLMDDAEQDDSDDELDGLGPGLVAAHAAAAIDGGGGGGGGEVPGGQQQRPAPPAEVPWPPLFSALEHLQCLRLAALNDSSHLGALPTRGPLQLDLYPLSCLRDLDVSGWQLRPGLTRLEAEGVLKGLTSLRCDEELGVAEWSSLHGMEELVEADLRAVVRGFVSHHVMGGTVWVKYGRGGWDGGGGGEGEAFRSLQFPMPLPPQPPQAGAGGGNGSGTGGAAAGTGSIFAAAPGGGGGGDGGELSWRHGRDRLQALAELHVCLEPLRFLGDCTSLRSLKLRWPPLPHLLPRHSPSTPLPPGDRRLPPRHWTTGEALFARSGYVPWLASLGELREVELWCPGGELVLDGPLLTALAPAWRRLMRLAFHGVVRQSALGALASFRGLRELGLYNVASEPLQNGMVGPCGAPGDERPLKLLLSTSGLPAQLERLALRDINVLHIPWVGVRALQRLELGYDCRWQAGREPASSVATDGSAVAAASATRSPGSPGAAAAGAVPVAAPGPWRLHGLSLLTHLDLRTAPVTGPELRAVLGSCGPQLRALWLGLPLQLQQGEQAGQSDSLLSALSDCARLLPGLVQLSVQLRHSPADSPASSTPSSEYTVAGHLGQWKGKAEDLELLLEPGAAYAARAVPRLLELQSHLRALLAPLQQLVSALLPPAVPAAPGQPPRLPRLRRLRLGLPPCTPARGARPAAAELAAALLPRLQPEVGAQVSELTDVLAELGQLTALEELQLAGIAAHIADRLEPRLLACMPHCHLDLRPAPGP